MRARARGRRAAVAAAVAIGAVTAVVGAGGSVPATVRSSQNAALGSILVNSGGRTLYHYLGDHGKTIGCTGGCATQWPPLLVAANATPVAGTGIQSAKLGSIKRPGGQLQVTYNGFALYRFAGDAKAGEVDGQGEGGRWYAIAPSGAVVKKVATSAAAAGNSGESSTGSSSTGSSNTGSSNTGSSSTGSSSTGSSTPGSSSTGSTSGGSTSTAPTDPGYGY